MLRKSKGLFLDELFSPVTPENVEKYSKPYQEQFDSQFSDSGFEIEFKKINNVSNRFNKKEFEGNQELNQFIKDYVDKVSYIRKLQVNYIYNSAKKISEKHQPGSNLIFSCRSFVRNTGNSYAAYLNNQAYEWTYFVGEGNKALLI